MQAIECVRLARALLTELALGNVERWNKRIPHRQNDGPGVDGKASCRF